METQHLLDALTDHMAVYHMRKKQLELRLCGGGKITDRQKVLNWLKSLGVKQRQAAFTIVDGAWVALLEKMQEHLESEGPVSFFVLPDFPSGGTKNSQISGKAEASLPGLCFRKARGLIKRLSGDGQLLVDSLRLYSSLDGEAGGDFLDCLTLSLEFLEDVDRLVEVMDRISYGQFLGKQCLSGGSSWEETPWLKSMGYYSLAAFVTNRLEICLWSAWVSALGTKQPSKSIPRFLARNAFDTVIVATRACAKRQGFEDWWKKLDTEHKRKASNRALATICKLEALRADDFQVGELNFRGNKRFAKSYVGIQLILDLGLTLNERLVYSPLSQVHGCSERVLQAVRNIMIKVMKDAMEFDLLEHGSKAAGARENVSSKKLQVKGRKSKGKKQKRNVTHRSTSSVEDNCLQPDKRGQRVDVARDQPSDKSQGTGWTTGKKKKKKKQEMKPEVLQPTSNEKTDHHTNTTETTVEETGETEASEFEKTKSKEPIISAHQNGPTPTMEVTKSAETKAPGLPPYVKHNQAFHLPPFAMTSAHEWPGASSRSRFPGLDSCGRAAATEWLHLDVNREWQNRSQPPLIAYTPLQNGQLDAWMQRSFISKTAALSVDWPPMVQTIASPFGFTDVPVPLPMNGTYVPSVDDAGETDEIIPDYTDDLDSDDYVSRNFEGESGDLRQLCEGDYNQIFGGGVMYWTSAEYTGMGYSRPGSLSSDDSSWARREADLTVVVDNIVGLTPVAAPYPNLSSGASTMTCNSPSSASSLSFDHLAAGEVQNGSLAGKADGVKCDHASQPVLPPIAVRESKSGQTTKLDGLTLHESRSPHVPRGRKDFVRWKRSPSPVLRCVPPAPPPPPPSPVAGVRKKRGFATARSGSSSPRHWGVFHWPDNQLKSLPPEGGILPTGWRRCIPNSPVNPLSGALLRERLVAIPSLALEQEHPDVAFPMQTSLLHKDNPLMPVVMAKLLKEIEAFCLQVAAENAARKPFVTSAVKKVTHALQVLWPRSRTKIFGSNATGLALPISDVDLVVCLPPVRNLEPIKEAGILEGRNGIKETCLQHAARYLADQEWVKSDSLKTIENTTIPIIMLMTKCFPESKAEDVTEITADDLPDGESQSCSPWGTKKDRHFVRLDISFESPSHTGVLTAELVKELVAQFPAITPLALVLKQFLTDRGLDQPYTGGLSSYCLVLLITRFLQHHHRLGIPSQSQGLGSLLMDFLHFFGCVFDPRRMCISIRGGGMYVSRNRLHGIDPLHIEDPLHPMNNVGRNCFRILQCTKAFADAYLTLEKELLVSSPDNESLLLPKILPSISADQ